MERADFAYLVLGVAAAAEHRSRGVRAMGARTVDLATRPAALVWRSPVAAPLRGRAAVIATSLDRDGREFAARSGARARRATEPLGALADRLLAAGLADEVVERLLATGALDRMITVALNHPATDALVANALDEPGLDRLVARVMDSRLVDDIVDRLLASDELQRVLDYVTHSPELRAALAHQTAGLADDFADGMRRRTETGDVLVERFARSLVRRGRRAKTE